MTYSPRPNRCDTVIALIDRCLADLEHSTTVARTNRPTRSHLTRLETMP